MHAEPYLKNVHPGAAQTRRGMLLLAVLVVLALVSAMSYRLAQSMLFESASVARQERDLREHWSLVTTRRLILDSAQLAFETRERSVNLASSESRTPASYVNSYVVSFPLNDFEISCKVQDENAKLHLPSLANAKPTAEFRDLVRRIQGPTSGELSKQINLANVSLSWRDLFERIDREPEYTDPLTERITLWGSGRLNIYRADEKTLNELWREVFGHLPPAVLQIARASYPRMSWQQLRDQLASSNNDRTELDRWFDSESSCFSVRVTVRERNESHLRASNAEKCFYFVNDRNFRHLGFREY